MNYVSVPTKTPENRPGVLVNKEREKVGEIYEEPHKYHIRLRENMWLSMERKFTQDQVDLMYDVYESDLSIDGITKFGLRPPELYFIDNPVDYLCWFSRMKQIKLTKMEIMINQNIMESAWVDGTNHHIKVRYPALKQTVKKMRKEQRLIRLPIYQLFNKLLNLFFNGIYDE